MKTKIAEVKITLSHDAACTLSVSPPKGIKGDDIYFSEHDGVKISDLAPAFMCHLPQGATIAYWDDDALSVLDGCVFNIRFVQMFDVDADGNEQWVRSSSYAY